jgi:Tol biopolymer transport system component
VNCKTRCGVLLVTALALAPSAPTAAQFGQNKITYQNFDWKVYESPHFNIHYYPETEPFLEEVVSHAESAYLKISEALDHELRFRVPLVVYKTHGEFEQTNITLSEVTEGIGAFAEPVQNRMVLPIDLPPDKLYQLIAHELTHIFEYSLFYDGYLGRALRANPPLWLMEGLASFLAQDEDNLDRMWIRDAVVNGTIPPIETLSVNPFLQYRYGHAIYDFIAQEHGDEGLRNFLFEYRKVLLTNNLEKAIKESFGYDLGAFNRNFDRYLRRKYYPVLLEKKSPDDYGTEIGLKKRGLYTFSPTISPSGELVAAVTFPGMELDLMVLSVEGGKKVKNLTKGFTNRYRYLVTKTFEGKRDLSWSPTEDAVAVFVRRENKWPLLVFNAVSGKRVREVVFKDIVQCSSPAFSPDGKRVAFEGNRKGVVDIFEVDLETKEIRNLTRDDFFDANPWYAEDGETLVYNRRIGAYWKIFTVDLADSEKKAQLTFGRASDLQPALSRDGGTIYFSSDRGKHGVFNIYSLDLSTAEVRQYTDVVGGCFAPVEMAQRGGDRNLVFSAIYEGTFRLYRMPLKEPERIIPAEQRLEEPIEAEPFEPPLSLRADETQKSDYKLKWDIDAPYVSVGVTDDGTFLSNAAIGFSDLMGNHRIQIVASTVEEYSNYNVLYYNLKRRFNWGVSGYDYRDYFLSQSTSGSVDRDQVYRLTGVDGFIQYPISRHYRIDTSVGFLENAQDLVVGFDPSGRVQFKKYTDRFASINLGITGDTTRYQSFGPYQGKRLSLKTWFAPHLSGDIDGDIVEHRLDFRAYKKATRRSLFAFRVGSIYNTGDREFSYGFGGINVLRGYDFREFVGSRLAWANLEFRFPLVDVLAFPILNLFQIRGIFFLDVGAAWYDDDLWWDPELQRLRLDAGGNPVKFDFWNSDLDEFQDARASYGAGFQIKFLGLPLTWLWSKPMDYAQWDPALQDFVKVSRGTVQEFYIVFDF